MKKLILLILLISASASVQPQALEDFLKKVEKNNPQLMALQKWLDAEATKAKTGIYPENPEFNYSFLMGSPEALGDQEEIEINQSFKLPGYYTSKSAIQQLDYKQKMALAEKRRREVFHSTRKAWFRLIWLNKKVTLLKTRNQDAEKLAELMKRGFESGQISKPAYDKARIYAITIQNQWRETKVAIDITRQQLEALNGNQALGPAPKQYPTDWHLPNLDSALNRLTATNPDLKMAQYRILKSEKEIEHQQMDNWPSFNVGFKSETILDQKLQGFQAGISIPLWHNTNKVKYARLKADQEKARFVQQENETLTRFRKLYNEVLTIRDNYLQMQVIMEEEQATAGSLALLESGQISFSEYIMEVEMVFDSRMTFLQNEKEYFVRLSKLKASCEAIVR